MMEKLSELFKALSEPLRLRIVRYLLRNGRDAYYGEELAKALGIPPYRLSRHLKVLKASGLVTERREGRWVYYRLAKPNGWLLAAIRRLLAEATEPSASPRDGQPGRGDTPVRRRLTHRQKAQRPVVVDWDDGPAVPGML